MLGLKALGHLRLTVFICNTHSDFVTYVERHVPWCYMDTDGSFSCQLASGKKCLRIWNSMHILGGFSLQSAFFILAFLSPIAQLDRASAYGA
jgi:hypothetical protein